MNRIEIEAPIDLDDLILPAGVTAESRSSVIEFDAEPSGVITFVLVWASGIPASMIATLLYNAIKKKARRPPKQITIERTYIEFEQGAITRFIQERIDERDGE